MYFFVFFRFFEEKFFYYNLIDVGGVRGEKKNSWGLCDEKKLMGVIEREEVY